MNKKKTILFFSENYVYGGGERYLIDVLKISHISGCNIKLVTNQYGLSEKSRRELEKEQIEYIELPLTTWNSIKLKFRPKSIYSKIFLRSYFLFFSFFYRFKNRTLVSRAISSQEPVISIAMSGGFPPQDSLTEFLIASKNLGAKTVLSCVSDPIINKTNTRLINRFKIKIMRELDLFVMNSPTIKNKLTLAGIHFKKNHLLLNPIQSRRVTSTNIRSNQKIKVLFMSRLDPMKGPLHLLKAYQNLCKTNKHIAQISELHYIGDGTEIETLKQKSESNANVFIHGFSSEDPVSIMEKYDILVLPSMHEGLPYVILEAMQAGIAIISTDVGGIKEIIGNNERGLLIQPDNIDAIENALKTLIESDVSRIRYGELAKQYLANQTFINSIQTQWLENLRNLAGDEI